MPFRILEIHNTKVCSLQPQGNFNIDISNQYLAIVRELPAYVDRIWIDMAGVTAMDASLLSTLLILHQECPVSGGIHVINCSKQIARVLSISGVDRFIPVHMSGVNGMDPDTSVYRLRFSDTR